MRSAIDGCFVGDAAFDPSLLGRTISPGHILVFEATRGPLLVVAAEAGRARVRGAASGPSTERNASEYSRCAGIRDMQS